MTGCRILHPSCQIFLAGLQSDFYQIPDFFVNLGDGIMIEHGIILDKIRNAKNKSDDLNVTQTL